MRLSISKYQVFSIVVALLFIGWLTKETKAQEGMLFADTTANWIIGHSEFDEFGAWGGSCRDDFFYRLYFFEGKAMLDGQEYSVIKSTCSYKLLGDCTNWLYEGIDRCDTSIHAYVREDPELKKVFYHSSSPGPWDICNRNLKERLNIDPDAYPFEELAMDFSLDSNQLSETVHISDRYESKLEAYIPDYYANGDSLSYLRFDSFDYPDSPGWTWMLTNGSSLIEGYGYKLSVFYPVYHCYEFEGYKTFYNFTTCYSKGGRFYRMPAGSPEGQQHGDSGVCKLREPLSISDYKKPAVQPWVINPAKGKLEFLNPITGNLVVQDPRGRIIFQDEVQELRFLDAQEWSQGLYLLHWENDGGVKVAKVVLDSR